MTVRDHNGFISFEREHWTEWFRMFASEGMEVPRFYMPVRRKQHNLQLECWILPLAPFVWVFYVLQNIVHSVILDCLNLLSHLDEVMEEKKKR